MERKLISEADSRPLVVLDPRAPGVAGRARRRRARGRLAGRALRQAPRLLAAAARRPPRDVVEQDLLAWPAAHVRLALLDESTGPSLVAAQNRRGLVVSSPPARSTARRAGSAARPAAACSSCPARCRTAAPCSRWRAAAPTSPGAGAARRRSPRWRALHELRRRPGPSRAGGAAPPRAPAPRRPLSRCRSPAPSACSRSPPSARCTGWCCWSRPPRARLGRRGRRRAGALALLAAGRLAGRARTLAAVGALVPLARARRAGRRGPRQLLHAGPLGRAERRDRPRDHRPAGRPRPVPGRRPVGAHRHPARRDALVLAAAALRVLAAPRAGSGYPWPRSCCSSLLYAIPAVALDFEDEFLRGAVLALLVLAFLRLEKLRVGDAGGGAWSRWPSSCWPDGRARRSTTTSRGSTTRTGRWRRRPPSPTRSGGTTATARSTGRATAASCCACAHGARRTGRPRTSTGSTACAGSAARSMNAVPELPDDPQRVRAWTEKIRVTIRNLRSDQFITAGYAFEVDLPHVSARPRATGTTSPPARCGAATPTPPRSTRRSRTSRSAAPLRWRAASSTRPTARSRCRCAGSPACGPCRSRSRPTASTRSG